MLRPIYILRSSLFNHTAGGTSTEGRALAVQVPSGRAKVKQQKTQEELEYDELEALQAEMAL